MTLLPDESEIVELVVTYCHSHDNLLVYKDVAEETVA